MEVDGWGRSKKGKWKSFSCLSASACSSLKIQECFGQVPLWLPGYKGQSLKREGERERRERQDRQTDIKCYHDAPKAP